ncbi:MAG TPA: hypothetical protein VM286_06705 [Candidatus Thermoplasmatota archaeon]|nr:hypothetical protein [Candidatus Thermoplasmatota archaeon]
MHSQGDERANVTRLIRVLALFVAFPTVTIGLALMLFDPGGDHLLHMGGFLVLGAVAIVAFAAAPRLAQKFVA